MISRNYLLRRVVVFLAITGGALDGRNAHDVLPGGLPSLLDDPRERAILPRRLGPDLLQHLFGKIETLLPLVADGHPEIVRLVRQERNTLVEDGPTASILGRAYQRRAAPALDARVGSQAAGVRGGGREARERARGGAHRHPVVELAPADDAPVRLQSAGVEIAGHDPRERLGRRA